MRGTHTALNVALKRLRQVKTPRSQQIQKQIQALLNGTQCPQNMVIEL